MLIVPITAHAETVDELLSQLPVQELEAFAAENGLSFISILKSILAGEIGSLDSLKTQLLSAIQSTMRQYWLQFAGIIGCATICELARAFAGKRQVHLAIDLLCRITTGLVLLGILGFVMEEAVSVCGRLRGFTDVASPVLVAAMMLTGLPTMAAAIPPSAVAADSLSVYLSTDYGLPLLRVAGLLAVSAGLSARFRLERLFKLALGIVKWMLGCCMTGFLGLMSMRSIALGGKDSMTVHTARFAVDNLLPIIGGELADTVSSVFASAILVKNVAGIAVCVLLVGLLLLPIVRLAVLMLMLRLTSAGLDMIESQSIAGMVDRFAQVIEAVMAVLAAVAALGMILAGAVVLTSGIG